MRHKLLGAFVCLLVLGLSSTALATTPSSHNATHAVEKELKNEYGIELGYNITCHRTTNSRYKCRYEGGHNTGSSCTGYGGTATAMFYHNYIEVRLSQPHTRRRLFIPKGFSRCPYEE